MFFQQSYIVDKRITPRFIRYERLDLCIGIVLVGDFTQTRPSRRQMDSLVLLVRTLENRFQIAPEGVIPHRAVKDTLCPGPRFPWAELQQRLR